jgi:RNA recognition motif-containing protein
MSNTKIYVGNLGFSTTNETLNDAFAQYGTVTSARIITDRDTNRSKGFGFVEMQTGQEAVAAINGMNGTELEGRQLNVSEAKPKTENSGPRARSW